MAWIEIHQALPTHRKTLAVADELGIEPVQVVGHLCCLWLWTLDNAPQGLLPETITARTIARAAQWTKKPELFVAALLSAGLLEDSPDGRHVHDWTDYAGRLVERRQRDADRKRTERGLAQEIPRTSNGQTQDIRQTSDGQNSDSRAGATVPNPTVPYLTGDVSVTLAREINQAGAVAGPASRAWAPARGNGTHPSPTADPELLAEHLRRIDQERASRAASQPSKNSSDERTDE